MAIYQESNPLPKPGAQPGKRLDRSGRKARARAIVFMILALAAGSSAAMLITRYLSLRSAQAAELPLAKVAVAARDLPLATTLAPEMVAFVSWPRETLPQGYFSPEQKADGRVTGRALIKGEPILETALAAKDAGLGMAAVIPSNMRAMTVQVNEASGVAGFIHPGDLVDVIATMQTPVNGHAGGTQEFRAKVVLQNVKVLAIGQDMVTQNAKPVKVPVVTLLVEPEQSERLALASTQGKVQLTLRSQADRGSVSTRGVAPPDLFGNYAEPKKPVERKVSGGAKPPEVVEILKGDKFEERKLKNGLER
jgi:pilus assembly protein CpaB